ncbi:MAG: SH3 domain-containing protein, partial [Caldanaerobacter sp.]
MKLKKMLTLAILFAFCFSLIGLSSNLLKQSSILFGSNIIGITINPSVSYNRTNAYNYAYYYTDKYCHDGTYRKDTYPYYGTATCSTTIDDTLANADCAHFVSCCIGNHNGYCLYSNSYYPGGGLNLNSDSPSSGSYGECESLDLAEDLLNNNYAVSVSPIEELEQSDVIIYNYKDNFFDEYSHHCVFYRGNYLVYAHSNHTSPTGSSDWWNNQFIPMGANTALFLKIGYKYSIGCWVRIPYYVPGTTAAANVRDNPGGNLIGTASRGALGQIIDGPISAYYGGYSYQWYKVSFESGFSGSGWITSRVLRAIENPHMLSVGDRVKVNNSAGLNVRTGPGLKQSIVIKIPNGTQGTVIQTATYSDLNYDYDDGYTWVKIQWDGSYGTGWSAQYYLEKISSDTGTINVNATLDGNSWSGNVNYSLSGPTSFSGSSVPQVFTGKPTGTYTISYISGGPPNATLTSITPSSSQTLSSGGTITFTMNFTTNPPTTGTINVNATLDGNSWSGN